MQSMPMFCTDDRDLRNGVSDDRASSAIALGAPWPKNLASVDKQTDDLFIKYLVQSCVCLQLSII